MADRFVQSAESYLWPGTQSARMSTDAWTCSGAKYFLMRAARRVAPHDTLSQGPLYVSSSSSLHLSTRGVMLVYGAFEDQ